MRVMLSLTLGDLQKEVGSRVRLQHQPISKAFILEKQTLGFRSRRVCTHSLDEPLVKSNNGNRTSNRDGSHVKT